MSAHHVISIPKGRRYDERLRLRAERLGYRGLEFDSHDLYFVRGVDYQSAVHIARVCVDEPFITGSVVGSVGITNHATDAVVVEVSRRPGVTDRVAGQLVASAAMLGYEIDAATGRRHTIRGRVDLEGGRLTRLVEGMLANSVIETWSDRVSPGFATSDSGGDSRRDSSVVVRGLRADQLDELNLDRGLALDHQEMIAIQRFFERIEREPTLAELETLAQTWSEHCAHKTFRAEISFTDGTVSDVDDVATSLLERLRRSTESIADEHRRTKGRSHVVSAFDGNAGIVKFDGLPPLAIKMETHNHPSAVEPFGGANTGVGGVVRDVLAAPAEPLALTNVLCFGPSDLSSDDLPTGVLHPSLIEEGVVAGVADYGNKIGVPTVAGAVIYDGGFVGNPLVFCGCVGRVLEGAPRISKPRPGDLVVVIGGATGRDGIKGATFSSMTMDATTGFVAGASVQIGDPIVERLVGEALVRIIDRERPMCTALTDCGAGGLSSAVGEMADGIGVEVQLDNVPRKYPGLAPWEVWLSEAQERMVLAVDPIDIADVQGICSRLDVGCVEIGLFTDSQRVVVRNGDDVVVDLPTSFLHHGRPRRKMLAARRAIDGDTAQPRVVDDAAGVLLAILGHPTIASKEGIIRRYDHEIRGATVLGPMSSPRQTGPSDGVVVAEPMTATGFALGIGVNPRYGLFDCEAMAWSAVDESIRNVVATGADPSQVVLLDNFSWGDPRNPETLGDLVAAVDGCVRAANDFRAPFISGKDSLNNEFEGVDGCRRSIPPTLVISALAQVPDADRVTSTAFTNPGNLIIVVGATRDELRGSHLDLILGVDHGGHVPGREPSARVRYEALHRLMNRGSVRSAHDLSEGGLAVALAESSLGGDLGVMVRLDAIHVDPIVALFSESNSRLIVEIAPYDLENVLGALDEAFVIGEVTASPRFIVEHNGISLVDVSLEQMSRTWNGGAA